MISARTLLVPALATLLAASTALAGAASAAPEARHPKPPKKYPSEYAAAPAYPESTMKLKVKGRPSTYSRPTLVVSGFNRHEDPDGYHLEVYLMDRTALKQCPRYQNDMVNLFINNDDVVDKLGSFNINGGDFTVPITHKHGYWNKIIYCAYSRYIVDDAAVGALKVDLRKARPRAK